MKKILTSDHLIVKLIGYDCIANLINWDRLGQVGETLLTVKLWLV